MEKICFSAMQSVIAACVVFPLAYYVPAMHPVTHVSNWPFLILVVALASLTAGALGLTIGTSVKPQQIGLIFGVCAAMMRIRPAAPVANARTAA